MANQLGMAKQHSINTLAGRGWSQRRIARELAVAGLPAISLDSDILLMWSGFDPDGGSGLASYTIYASTDGGSFVPFITNTTAESGVFAGELGHAYALYSRATDNVGNVEAAPAAPDAVTQTVACFDDADCDDSLDCTCDYCTSSQCRQMTVPWGNANCLGPANQVDLDDILCVLAGFSAFVDCPLGDVYPRDGNNIISLDDILGLLAAFGGSQNCTNPCQSP